MTYLILFLLLLSNLALAYAYFASLRLPGMAKTLSWIAPEGTAPGDFILPALLLAIVSQLIMIGLLLWQKARGKSLLMKLREEREHSEQMRSTAKEIEKKISAQERALESAKGAGEKAALLQTRLESQKELEQTLRDETDRLERENERLHEELHKFERSEKRKRFKDSLRTGLSDRVKGVRRKLRNLFHKGS